MFRDLRLSLGLTQQELADLTGRTRNYIIKAEQCTFPSPPVALVNFYQAGGTLERLASVQWPALNEGGARGGLVTLAPAGAVGVLDLKGELFEGIPKEILESAYYSEQQRIRKQWLFKWIPRPADTLYFSFKRKWISAISYDISGPTEYEVSRGLCLPAASVFKAEKDHVYAQVLRSAMDQLIEYVDSGEYEGESWLNARHGDVAEGLRRIRREIG
jgi:transcriptional regulator with XRE-family HTH domain